MSIESAAHVYHHALLRGDGSRAMEARKDEWWKEVGTNQVAKVVRAFRTVIQRILIVTQVAACHC